jgi:hypothetical protein
MYFSISLFYFGVADQDKAISSWRQHLAKESPKQTEQDLKTLIMAYSSSFG